MSYNTLSSTNRFCWNYSLTLEYCILSTMSSLVRGMSPENTRNTDVTNLFFMSVCSFINCATNRLSYGATYRLCGRWTHHAVQMNWHQSGSSQLLERQAMQFSLKFTSYSIYTSSFSETGYKFSSSDAAAASPNFCFIQLKIKLKKIHINLVLSCTLSCWQKLNFTHKYYRAVVYV